VWAEVGATMRERLQSFTLADMVDRAQGNRGAPPPAPPASYAGGGRGAAGLEGALESLVGSGS